MTDKPHASFALPGHGLVTLEGRDALAFAQAQFMSDVASLGDGAWHWSGWLTPKGRVVALFALLRRDAETVWLVLPDADRESFATALRRYVFRSKVVIGLADVPIAGRFGCGSGGSRDRAVAASAAPTTQSRVALDMSGDGGPRSLLMGEAAPADADALARWTAADLAHGLPRLPPSQVEKWTPQQLSLERLRAFSVKKGCYPGQEIVARTHFLGQAKRGLVLLDADAAIEVGAEVISGGGQAIGTVASAMGGLALAVLPLAREADGLTAGGVAVRERPLLGGLAR